MNRKNEFEAMIEELNRPAPGLEATLDRAYRKKRKRTAKRIFRPVAGLAACFAAFVLLVNFSAPVAYACSQVPVLKELAAAVTFSRSLSDAVENDYVQTMDLSQTENEITAEIAYLIVDQKQVNVFYRVDSDQHTQLAIDPRILNAEGRFLSCSFHNLGADGVDGALRSLCIDFVEDDVPESLRIQLNVYTNEVSFDHNDPNYLARFDFLLEFDPKFTAAGKIFPVNQTVILDGQTITVTDIEVYPTHLRVDIAESPENTAWIKALDFYIETDWGMKFETGSGIIATGTSDSRSMTSFRADSTYFYEAEHLKLVITGAEWLRKDMGTTYLNLVTGEHGPLPEGVEFDSAFKEGSNWVVKFRAGLIEDKPMYQLFASQFYDTDGNRYEVNMWSNGYGENGTAGNATCFYEKFWLTDYPYDEVWLSPHFSHRWTAEDVIVITVQ